MSTIDEAIQAIEEAVAAGKPSWPHGSAGLYIHLVRDLRKRREARRSDQAQQQAEG